MLRTHFAALALCLCTFLRAAAPQNLPWWRHAVFYQIYLRSFQDSKGDGVGDLNGVTARLDYLRDLGVDALWLTPCFPSPQVDFGYDISEYRDIDPRFGTLQDFDRLLAEARQRGIRVLLDLVPNHTSDQHPWFQASRASRQSPRRDWYVWRDGRGPGLPPSNWQSLFGGSAWTLDPATGQYYYHYFYKEQPDLNWRNPEVRKEMFDTARFWFRRGVAGFRLDAVDTLFEDPGLRDNPVQPGRNAYGDANMDNVFNYRLPEEHGLLRDLRRVADAFDAVLIGETYCETPDELRAYYGKDGDELQLPTGHLLAMTPNLSAAAFRTQIQTSEAVGRWPVQVLGNHDLARAVTRFGDGVHDDAIAKLLASIQLTLRGTPVLYYGEELGMVNNDPKRPEEALDPQTRLGWPWAKRRDGERTPMQWDATPGAGFSTGRPWLAIPDSARTHNVATEAKDPASVLSFYRRLLALRRSSPALLDGDYHDLSPQDGKALTYLRTWRDQAVLVLLNLSATPRETASDLAGPDWRGARAQVLLSTEPTQPGAGLPMQIGPYGVVIAAIGNTPFRPRP